MGSSSVDDAAFSALDALLAEGGPRVLAAEVASSFLLGPPAAFPSTTAQEVVLSVLRHCLARLPRLLLRFATARGAGGLAALSRLAESLLMEHTNASGLVLAPPPRPDK